MKISPKTPSEIIPVTFDYSELGVTAIDAVYQVGIYVVTGTDAASADMVIGSPTTDGATVTQLIRNGVAGVTYRVYCIVNVDSEKYQIDGDMVCKAWHSS